MLSLGKFAQCDKKVLIVWYAIAKYGVFLFSMMPSCNWPDLDTNESGFED